MTWHETLSRFDLTETTIELAPGRSVTLSRVREPNLLVDAMDEDDFGPDERLPYWATLWPSAVELARELVARAAELRSPALELGAGMGLASVAAASIGLEVLTTDYEPDALAFAAHNAERNGLRVATQLVDWRERKLRGPFATIFASDVLYEARNVKPVSDTLDRLLTSDGVVVLADPNRPHLPGFIHELEVRRLQVEHLRRGDIRIIRASRSP